MKKLLSIFHSSCCMTGCLSKYWSIERIIQIPNGSFSGLITANLIIYILTIKFTNKFHIFVQERLISHRVKIELLTNSGFSGYEERVVSGSLLHHVVEFHPLIGCSSIFWCHVGEVHYLTYSSWVEGLMEVSLIELTN